MFSTRTFLSEKQNCRQGHHLDDPTVAYWLWLSLQFKILKIVFAMQKLDEFIFSKC